MRQLPAVTRVCPLCQKPIFPWDINGGTRKLSTVHQGDGSFPRSRRSGPRFALRQDTWCNHNPRSPRYRRALARAGLFGDPVPPKPPRKPRKQPRDRAYVR